GGGRGGGWVGGGPPGRPGPACAERVVGLAPEPAGSRVSSGRRTIQRRAIVAMPAARIAPVAMITGRRSTAPASAATMPHFTAVLASVARTMELTATCVSPLLAYSAIDNVMASTSVRPASTATM